jgi:hypothetical protein
VSLCLIKFPYYEGIGIRDLTTRRSCVVNFTPRLLYLGGKSSWYPWIGGWVSPRMDWTLWRRENLLSLVGIERQILSRLSRRCKYCLIFQVLKTFTHICHMSPLFLHPIFWPCAKYHRIYQKVKSLFFLQILQEKLAHNIRTVNSVRHFSGSYQWKGGYLLKLVYYVLYLTNSDFTNSR